MLREGANFERQSGSLTDWREDHFRWMDGIVDHR